MNTQKNAHHDAIYRRTRLGQHAAIGEFPALDADARRLLLVVNGITPIGQLAKLAPQLGEPRIAESLLRSGMIEACRDGTG